MSVKTSSKLAPEKRISFNIGEAAAATGVSAKMIRHYESIGLMPKARRSESGYRVYTESDLHNLRFIRASRSLGFSIEKIRTLLELWRNKSRQSSDVKALANEQIHELEFKISELQKMVNSLKELARHCHGDDRPQCPIIEGIASPTVPKTL